MSWNNLICKGCWCKSYYRENYLVTTPKKWKQREEIPRGLKTPSPSSAAACLINFLYVLWGSESSWILNIVTRFHWKHNSNICHATSSEWVHHLEFHFCDRSAWFLCAVPIRFGKRNTLYVLDKMSCLCNRNDMQRDLLRDETPNNTPSSAVIVFCIWTITDPV